MYFLALSQAPPVLAYEVAITSPLARAPGSKPAIAIGPKKNPKTNGVKRTIAAGPTMLSSDDLVAIAIQEL